MKTLQRITTQYDVAEDRLKLVGSLEEADTVTLWLTQRLLSRLLGHLLQWLEQQSETEGKSGGDALAQITQQEFAQQTAVAGMTPQEPVTPREHSGAYLIGELDVKKSDEAVIIIFKLGEQSVQLPFDSTALRQWLTIVFSKWCEAEWRPDVWPAWIRDPMNPPGPEAGNSAVH